MSKSPETLESEEEPSENLDNGVIVMPTSRRPHPAPATEEVTKSPEQYAQVEGAIRDLLNAFNVNWEDPHYTNTPSRVAKAYLEYWASGYSRDPRDEITVFPNNRGANDMVMVKDMRFYSLCSHHLAPIEGYAAIAYLFELVANGPARGGQATESNVAQQPNGRCKSSVEDQRSRGPTGPIGLSSVPCVRPILRW